MFDLPALEGFIESCMSSEGGVAPHPGDAPDPFHTFFGLAGLSLAQHAARGGASAKLQQMDPALVLPIGRLASSA